MNLLKNILGRVLALWAALVFIATLMLIVLPVWLISFLPEPKRTGVAFKIFNPWLSVFFFLTGVRRVYKGRQHFTPGKVFVVVCNHRSFMDVPLCSPGIPAPNKTIAKVEMARIPIFGVIYKSGSVLVNRKNPTSRQHSYNQMKQVLQMGLHMCIYPEGTRNKTSHTLMRFQDGAFRLAKEAGVCIIPAVILHTQKVMPANKGFYFWPHRVEMHFLQPVATINKTVEDLNQEVYAIMKAYYEQHQ